MFNAYRAPNHPTHAYTFIGAAATVEAAKALLPTLVCIEEDDANPGHFDAFAVTGDIYSIIPEGSRFTPARTIAAA